MSWEPWLAPSKPEEKPHDPDDPALLSNVLAKDMTEEDHERARQWVLDLITSPEPVK